MIINADCDLEHEKTDGVIAYLPIYRFRSYLENFWAPDHVATLRLQLLSQIQQLCGLSDSDLKDLERWLLSGDAAEIGGKLATAQSLKAKVQSQLIDALKKLQVCIDPTTGPFETFLTFCRYEKEPEKHARKQIVAAKKSMSDGHFFISDMVGEPDVGFVIRMRRIYTIDAASCFTSTVALETSGATGNVMALRFARMTPMYAYKIAQLFAQQFSRIGLPDEVTALGELAIEDIVASLRGGSQ